MVRGATACSPPPVTDGALLDGVKFRKDVIRDRDRGHALDHGTVRWIRAEHRRSKSSIWIERGSRVRLCVGMAVLGFAACLPFDAEAASCRGYDRYIVSAIKAHVEALRSVEREAADRLAGLDTRVFEYLLNQARSAASVIGDERGLAEEDDLKRCRNYIPPVRRNCTTAARALVVVIEALAAGPASKTSNQTYAAAMPQCERWMDLKPLNTVLRNAD